MTALSLVTTNPVEPVEVDRFDYQLLSVTKANELRALAKKLKGQIERQESEMLEIGRQLLAGKAMVGHGNFKLWVEHEVGLKIRSAQRLMNAAELVDSKSVSLTHFGLETLYELSAPSTPPELVEKVVADLKAEKPLVDAEVKQQIRDARDEARRLKLEQQRLERRKRRKLTEAEIAAMEAKAEAEQRRNEERQRQRQAEADRLADILRYGLTAEELAALQAFLEQPFNPHLLTRALAKITTTTK